MSRTDEFEFIAQFLAPLAAGYEGAFGLADDAARMSALDGLIVTTDTLVQGVHFRHSDDWQSVAGKAVRVNLSDLAGMAARPHAVMLSITWPEAVTRDQQEIFALGFGETLKQFQIPLIGGDSTRGGDRLVVTVTAFGETQKPLLRSKAKPGDHLFVTGTIGDAGLGLTAFDLGLEAGPADVLNRRYLQPEPRLTMAEAAGRFASAGMDISDGLIADAGHIAAVSGVGIEIYLSQLPLSGAAMSWLERQSERDEALVQLATAGDDYELLLSVPVENTAGLQGAADAAGIALTRIGRAVEGAGVRVLDTKGEPVQIIRSGFTHF
ncbi:thiamine-phosphate kinase [Hyphobacterium sp.]|uniref:thiamine-phosphate kinase n=1 Tax=Hyphobacterium sp. TaxID=2004662 RepID=UPI003BA8A93E